MKKHDIIGFAFGNFFRRKARSVLTVLGVVIGTASVVIMLSIGIGMQEGFQQQISEYGNVKLISVYEKYSWDENGNMDETVTKEYLDKEGYEKILALDHIEAATPIYNGWNVIIEQTQKQKSQISVNGIDVNSMEAFDYELLSGRLLNESDKGTYNFVMNFAAPFYFYGYRDEGVWWYEFVGGEDLPFDPLAAGLKYKFTWDYNYGAGPVDTSKPKKILIDGECVGILKQNANNDWNANIYMDVDAAIELQKILNENQNAYWSSEYSFETFKPINDSNNDENKRASIYSEFRVLCDNMDNVQQLEKEIRELGFETSSSMEYLTYMEEQTAFLRGILGAIGLVAFIVAAISIVNTMIMAIYERTREIGIMKVLGCKLGDVRGMFLFEAGIIGFIGGVVGCVASHICSAVVNSFSRKGGLGALGLDGIDINISVIPIWLDFAALALATLVGIAAGLYPAFRATKLSALEAIKNE